MSVHVILIVVYIFVDLVKRCVLTLVGGDTAVQKWTLVILLLRFSE